MTPAPTQILARIETALAAIDGTGDFITDVAGAGGVQRWTGSNQLNDLPALVVRWVRDTPSDGPVPLITHKLRVVIACYPDPAGQNLMDQISDLVTDVRRALYADRTLSGDAVDTTIQDTAPFEQEDGAVGADVDLEVHYRTSETDPEVVYG